MVGVAGIIENDFMENKAKTIFKKMLGIMVNNNSEIHSRVICDYAAIGRVDFKNSR